MRYTVLPPRLASSNTAIQILFYANSGTEGGGFVSLYLSCEVRPNLPCITNSLLTPVSLAHCRRKRQCGGRKVRRREASAYFGYTLPHTNLKCIGGYERASTNSISSFEGQTPTCFMVGLHLTLFIQSRKDRIIQHQRSSQPFIFIEGIILFD